MEGPCQEACRGSYVKSTATGQTPGKEPLDSCRNKAKSKHSKTPRLLIKARSICQSLKCFFLSQQQKQEAQSQESPTSSKKQKQKHSLTVTQITRGSAGSSVGPLPANWRPSSRGQTVSRAAAAVHWASVGVGVAVCFFFFKENGLGFFPHPPRLGRNTTFSFEGHSFWFLIQRNRCSGLYWNVEGAHLNLFLMSLGSLGSHLKL